MTNPLAEKVEKEFERLGFPKAELLRESYDAQSFGNAQAIYKLGNLYLNFIRDRSEDTVSFLNPDNLNDHRDYYIFCDIAVLMEWTTPEEVIADYKKDAVDFSKPPSGPIPLGDALELVRRDYEQLQRRFSPLELGNTFQQLKDIRKKRCKALFGKEPPQ